ncbi:MAG: hypothetical protein Q4A00_04755 [Flavobacteriaceae bacterium]|nr:hypothetical protein [Flavobacteriaceae bacterium]
MKKYLIFCLLGLFSLSFAQKHKKCKRSKNEVIFSTDKFLFHAETTGGEEFPGFSILKNQTELNFVCRSRVLVHSPELKQEESKLIFPKNQKVILYNFGEFRSGIHKPKGIEKLKIVGEDLEVYLKREIRNNTSDLKLQRVEQVITRPKMIFSVPAYFEFKNIIIK